ncbi:uncharacterized protein avpi1 [Osmerus eperlanus]|uniref:uncharacterized protein avpi1 n=1 Tax=Osmerus eperlanus TaxID=29151 RepID=UPI002E150CE3
MEGDAPPSGEDGQSLLWRQSRKTGCSNIFAGVNLRQLRRLFHVAGDRDAEHRARLVWGRGRGGRGGGEEAEEAEEERKEEEEGGVLAQALVGMRARARTRMGRRAEGLREPRWLRAFGQLRIREGSLVPPGGEEGDDPTPDQSADAEGPLVETERTCERPPCSPGGFTTWRSGVNRQEVKKDPERYLHRILH